MATRVNPSRTLAVAEMITKMSVEEQAELVLYLSWSQLRAWEMLKRELEEQAVLPTGEPEVYVEVKPDVINFETPADRVLQVLSQLAQDLNAKDIQVRFDEDSQSREFICSPSNLMAVLEENKDLVSEEPVVIEYGEDTLYSNGGGCMMLKTVVNDEVKREIARHFLTICGFPYPVEGNRFTALVRNGKLAMLSLLFPIPSPTTTDAAPPRSPDTPRDNNSSGCTCPNP